MNVILATCRKLPEATPSDAVLATALTAAGATVRVAPWDTVSPGSRGGDLVCLRSAWDYHRRPAEFRRWLAGFAAASSGRLVNPAATVTWNLDKTYLKELTAGGVAIPATNWLESVSFTGVAASFAATGWDRAVLKPRISATAYGTCLLTRGDSVPSAVMPALLASGALLQEFVPEIISRGEVSLVYLDGKFSHAVLKRGAAGEYRVQSDFGGTAAAMEATPALRAFGDRVLALTKAEWLYARVDVVETAAGIVLMELELIEPDLFFNLVPGAAPRLAEALVREAAA